MNKITFSFIGIALFILAISSHPAKAYATACNSGTGNYSTATDGTCSFAGTYNGANGVLTVAAGTTLTITSGQTIGASSIVIQSGGVIALPQNGSGSVKPGTFPWLLDADNDGYPSAVLPDKVQTTAPTSNHYKKDNAHWTSITTPDCYDLNAQAHPGQTAYQSVQRGDTSWDYDCSGAVTYQYETCVCKTCVDGCPAAPTCTLYTTATGYTTANCGATQTSPSVGPGSCTRVNDGYGTCTACNNGAAASYVMLCL